jgi:hypothetical protein
MGVVADPPLPRAVNFPRNGIADINHQRIGSMRSSIYAGISVLRRSAGDRGPTSEPVPYNVLFDGHVPTNAAAHLPNRQKKPAECCGYA